MTLYGLLSLLLSVPLVTVMQQRANRATPIAADFAGARPATSSPVNNDSEYLLRYQI